MLTNRTREEHADTHRWLVSYADFITLLCAFFIVMYAASTADRIKARQTAESFRRAFGASAAEARMPAVLGGTPDETGTRARSRGPNDPNGSFGDLDSPLGWLKLQLADEIKQGRVDLKLEPRGLVISMREASLFQTADDQIDSTAYPVLEKIADAAKQLPNPIRLEGHTDSRPVRGGRFRSNWELSAARSIAVMEMLANRFGIERQRMSIAGYAENFPVSPNDSEEGRAHNRRVDIILLTKEAQIAQPATLNQ